MQFDELFSLRRNQQQTKIFKYFKYIFNDHFVIALMFFIGALGFQYSQWIKTISAPNIWFDIILVTILTLTSLIGNLATYVKRADQQFLLAIESKWLHYFEKAINGSMLLPTGLIALVSLMSYPYLLATQQIVMWELGILFIQAVVLKYFNMYAQFTNLRLQNQKKRNNRQVMSVTLTFVTLLVSVQFNMMVGLAIAVLATLMLVMTERRQRQRKFEQWDWTHIVLTEERRQQNVNRVIALFIDIPQLTVKTHRRKYLDGLLIKAKNYQSPYAYLYSRAFWRGNQLSALWLRLTLIGVVLLMVLPSHWLTVIIAVVIQYISHFQLLPLFKQFDRHLLLQTYPVNESNKISGFQQFMTLLLFGQWLLFLIILLIFNSLLTSLVFSLFGLGFAFFFNVFYIPNRLYKKTK